MEKILKTYFCIFSFCLFLAPSVFAQKIEAQAKKLKDIEEQIERRNKELEEYMTKTEELKTQLKAIKTESDKENEKKEELENSLKKAQSNIGGLKEKYSALKDIYLRLMGEMSMDGAKLYLESFEMSDYYGKDNIVKSVSLRNLIIGKSALAKSVDKKSDQTDREMKNLIARREQMAAEKRKVLARLEMKRKEMGRTQKEMDINKKRLKNLKEEIERLKESASELSGLIKKLEKKAPYKSKTEAYVPIEKNSLPWPMEGTVISKFGKEYVPQLKTWIVRDGIRIKAETGARVKSVMSGTVIYCGPFRNYGNIVIVSHKDNIFTTYGLLSSVAVKNGEAVTEGTVLGFAGEDEQTLKENKGSALYFEIRRGSDAADPMPYLK
ncbi:MAG: peptidoglycan DD-metalloendopeptidase family protein [Elusimicrobia bacterium]|nr:peptidoglycan DD-metalloendopeptidase family protein [Elusimicrobiota bacterium]